MGHKHRAASFSLIPAGAPLALCLSPMSSLEWRITLQGVFLRASQGLGYAYRKYGASNLKVNHELGEMEAKKEPVKLFIFPSPIDYSRVQYLQTPLPEKDHMLSEHKF